ncbi:MAG: hypothetical protein H6745_02750 [Deltaproteobacteria bacterium]|nr:hypothetical protein [Deltaproteobacteria bacterium]
MPTGRHQVAVAVGDEPARSEVVEVGGGPAVLAPGAAACDGRGLSAGGAADTVRP